MTLGRKLADRMRAVNDVLDNGDIAKLIPRYVTLDLQPKQYSASDVKQVRELLGIPQRVLAVMLGVSIQTIRAWEQGRKTPSQMACRFLDKVMDDPSAAMNWLRRMATKSAT